MSKIKTREKGKDIKVLDKSAVVGQRMKTVFLRSRERAGRLMDDRRTTPGEYAGEQAELAADDVIHDAANLAVSGAKTTIRQGRDLFQRQRTKRWETSGPTTGQVPATEMPTGTAPERFPRYERMAECPADTIDKFVERGRTFAKKQSAKRAEQTHQREKWALQPDRTPQARPQDTAKAPRQMKTAVKQTANNLEPPLKSAKWPAQAVRQTTKAAGKGTVKSAQRTIKTAQGAKGTVKTTQRTSKTAIKTAEHTTWAAQKTAQATAKAAKAAARTAHITARTAAATAKAAAKALEAAIKATIAATKALIAALAAGGWVAVLAIVIICLIGLIASSAFGIFFSGEDSGTGQTMPTVVREINQEYEGRLSEIQNSQTHDTLEMSGSRAVWPEVLAVYAVKTTTDPVNPQEVATIDDGKKALLKEIFWEMNDITYQTQTRTETVITKTDDGRGNIVETTETVTKTILYIQVSHKTAGEMADVCNFTADQRAPLAELLAEENRGMWSGVLYGIGTGDGEIVSVALSQLGNVGGAPYWSWYGFTSRVDWCACFVSWCANECGYLETGVIPRFASCSIGIQWFRERGLWQENSYEPRPGDLIFFDWDDGDDGQDGAPDHVGIVVKAENGVIYTVEGNSGDRCRERQYALGHDEIYGFGTPAY